MASQRSVQWLAAGSIVVLIGMVALAIPGDREGWTSEELATLQRLSLGGLPPVPPDPSNAVADDPRAVDLGHRLFFDPRTSANGEVACASCHLPDRNFTDGLPLSEGIGTTNRTSMTIVGTAHSPWLFWDGRADSQWSQALGPLEDPVEHGGDRTAHAHLIAEHYRADYESLFGPLPDLSHLPAAAGPVEDPLAAAAWERMEPDDREAVTRVFVGIGKAIAAYERRIMPGRSRFDDYVDALAVGAVEEAAAYLDGDEVAGLRLFIGDAGCVNCHDGPLLTNHAFHNTGVPARPDRSFDEGRAGGARHVREDPFNCLGDYSDAGPAECAELRFLKADGHELERAFKVPTLRNVAEAGPYMHAGQFSTLREVIEHYDAAPEAPAGHSELAPLGLSERERSQLEAFLRSLSAPLATPERLLRSPHER